MGYPTDPDRRALCIQRLKDAQRKRWENQEERRRFSEMATAQWSNPEARQRMSEIKKRVYQERPELRERAAIHLRHVTLPVSARVEAVKEAYRRKRLAKATRLGLIRERALKSQNGPSQSISVRSSESN